MNPRPDELYWWNGYLYLALNSVRVAAGLFLSAEHFHIEKHIVFSEEHVTGLVDRYKGGVRLPRQNLAAAEVHGNSMILENIHHGDVIVFKCSDFPSLHHGEVVVIEKIGDEEGTGAWALKKLIIEKPRTMSVDEYDDEIDFDDPVIVLRSANPTISPRRLERPGEYRVRGVYLRVVSRNDVRAVESDWIRSVVFGSRNTNDQF
jgi:hypothetical protein